MLKNKNLMQKGFTIVELLIVIVVIAILAALVLNTFAGVQEKARDSDRQNDVATIQKHLETYYTDHGSYPAQADLANYTWVDANMEGLAEDAFIPPQEDAVSLTAATATAENEYGYVTTPGTCGSPTDASGADATPTATCESFVISWFSEVDEEAKETPSLSD